MKELRAKADRAAKAVRAEEDRQRQEYNDALAELHDQVEQQLADAGWVVRLSSRKHEQYIDARPGWASEQTLKLRFVFSEEESFDVFEDAAATSVELWWMPVGETCRFNCPPPRPVLEAVLGAYMKLAADPA